MYHIVCESISIHQSSIIKESDGMKAGGKIVANLLDDQAIKKRQESIAKAAERLRLMQMRKYKPGLRRAWRVANIEAHKAAKVSGGEDFVEGLIGGNKRRVSRGAKTMAITVGRNIGDLTSVPKAAFSVAPAVAVPVAHVVSAGFKKSKKKK